MSPDVDVENRIYEEIESMDKLKSVVEEYLIEHNSESKQPMPLVMFTDALEHVAKIARVRYMRFFSEILDTNLEKK